MSNKESFEIIFLGTSKDTCSRIRYEFEAKVERRPYSSFLFALCETGERIIMGSKHFFELSIALQSQMADAARVSLGFTPKSTSLDDPNINFKLIFLQTVRDKDDGRIRHEFEAKVDGRDCSSFLFALSEDGEQIVMGSKYFQDLPFSLQKKMATQAYHMIQR